MSLLRRTINNLEYVHSKPKRIGYIGWLGHGNLGDEAMYAATKRQFNDVNILPYKYTYKIKAIETFLKRRTYAIACLGGGTLINTKGELECLNKAINRYCIAVTYGTGVRNPLFWKTRYDQDYLNEWIVFLEKCKYVSVRGPISKGILESAGFHDAQIIGDPALCLARKNIKEKGKDKKLGISINPADGKLWGSEQEVLDVIVAFSKVMIDDGWQISFLPGQQKDIQYIQEAVKMIGRSTKIFTEYLNLEKVLNFLEDCDVFLGERLHSVILAMCAYTPAIMLEYRPKCLDFMTSMGLEEFNIRTDKLSVEDILVKLDKLNNNSKYYQEHVFKMVRNYKHLQKKARDSIVNLMTDEN